MSKIWIAIVTIMLAATLSGCAKDASGDDHKDEAVVTSDTTTTDKDDSGETISVLTSSNQYIQDTCSLALFD